MSQLVDREGDFQGVIYEYGLREFDSGTVAISIRARLDAMWNGEEWEDWKQYDVEAFGSLFIIKRNGELNNTQVESLVRSAGWDGTMNSVVHGTWKPTPCQFSIKSEVYKEATQFKIAFVNPFDRVPGGGMGNIDADKAKQLEAKFGASLRAIAGNVKRNTVASGQSAPPAPPKPNGAWKPPTVQQSVASAAAEDIPF